MYHKTYILLSDDMPSSTTHNLMANGNAEANGDQSNMMAGMFSMLGPMVGPISTDPNMMMVGPIVSNRRVCIVTTVCVVIIIGVCHGCHSSQANPEF